MFILEERSRGRWSKDDLKRGVLVLGFGRDNALSVELDDDVDDDFILRAWRDGVKRSWKLADGGSGKRAELHDALKVLAEARASKRLVDAWRYEKGSGMSPDSAYSTLQVPSEVDEEMLLTVYGFRVSPEALCSPCGLR